jgi:hypothetical protein
MPTRVQKQDEMIGHLFQNLSGYRLRLILFRWPHN